MDPERDAGRPYPYEGPESLREPIESALRRVVDPEIAMTIVDVGLVYRVEVNDDVVRVRMTTTSAACPAGELVVHEVRAELEDALPPRYAVEIECVREPAWSPERMSARAKAFMGW